MFLTVSRSLSLTHTHTLSLPLSHMFQRCVELIAAAAAHGVDEAWISKHPVLGLGKPPLLCFF